MLFLDCPNNYITINFFSQVNRIDIYLNYLDWGAKRAYLNLQIE